MVPVSFQVPAAILLLGGGLLACFLGYRLFRVVLAIYGFVVGAFLATALVDAAETWRMILTASAGGLLGALVLFAAYYVGVALAGAALGALAVHLVWSRLDGEPHALIVIAFTVAGAFGALALRRYVIIVATAFGGAWTALVGGFALTGNTAALAATSGDIWEVYPMAPMLDQQGFAMAWFALGLLAAVVQLAATGKTRKTRRRKKS